ncbi:MAG: HlyD family efflux transporter periplasmic adaptor subunit [Betaproteobacteria bacterium]|nr:HlyD family efflux transporter periplasmic adaptor subunit [Betaproteobacteria bacterium]
MPRALLRDVPEIFEIPRWPLGWIALGALLLLALKSLVPAGLAHLDLVIATEGRVLSPAIAVMPQTLEGAVVGAVRVRNGQAVQRNEVLLRVAAPATAAAIDRLRREQGEALLDMLRLEALLAGDPRVLNAPADADPALVERARSLLARQMQTQQAHVKTLRQNIARDRASRAKIAAEIAYLETATAQLHRRMAVEQSLVERQFVSEARLARVRGQLAEKYRNQSAIAQRLAEVDERIAHTSLMLHGAAAAFRARTLAERAAAARRFEATGQALALKDRDLREIRAPDDGFVRGALALVNGDAVREGQPLLRIVPADAEFEFEALLPNGALRWIVEGQRIALRLAPSEPGNLLQFDGEVARISGDALHDAMLGSVYPVRIRIVGQSLSDPELLFALAARADTPLRAHVHLGARSVIDWLLQKFWRRDFASARRSSKSEVRAQHALRRVP